jgi:hypothetical protein
MASGVRSGPQICDWLGLHLALKAVVKFLALSVECLRVRVRVTLQLTVSQSASLGVEPNLELLTRDRFFILKVTVLSFGGALSDERSGLSFVSLCQYSLSSQSVFTYCVTHIWHFQYLRCVRHIYNKIQYVQYIQASFSPGFVQQIMPYLLGATAVLDTWTVVHMTAAKFELLIFCVECLSLNTCRRLVKPEGLQTSAFPQIKWQGNCLL